MNLRTKAALLAAAVALAGVGPSDAQMIPGQRLVPLGQCQLTSIDTVALLSACAGGIPAGSTVAIIKAEAQAVRWRDDGTAPTATVGMPMATTDAPLVYTGALSAFRVIGQVAGGKLDVAFYRGP